jgi:hypothetical protein
MLFALQPPGTILCYPFRYVDELTGKWKRARYLATLHEIAKRHAQWKIDGEPEIRGILGRWRRCFSTHSVTATR